MRGVNKVILIGNLGKDPDLQYLEGDIPVAKFPLATTEVRKERNGNVISETEWHNVVLWRGLAELAGKFLHKGSMIYIEGKLRTRNREDKDKVRRFQTEIIGENMVMLGKKKDNESCLDMSSPEDVHSSAPDEPDCNRARSDKDRDGLAF